MCLAFLVRPDVMPVACAHALVPGSAAAEGCVLCRLSCTAARLPYSKLASVPEADMPELARQCSLEIAGGPEVIRCCPHCHSTAHRHVPGTPNETRCHACVHTPWHLFHELLNG